MSQFEPDLSLMDLDDLNEMRGYREAPEDGSRSVESTPLSKPWQDVISRRAYDFVVRWETGGRAYYDNVIKGRPIWPGYASGITIGCGFDLGYHTKPKFDAQWGGRLPRAEFDRLIPALGFKTTDPIRDAKVGKAKTLVRSFRDIVISWDVAIAQFDESKMPALVGDLYAALDNLDRLHPHSRGALLSLVFNRGSGGFARDGDRYRELRDIHKLMRSGTASDFARIPDRLLSMRRIWGPDSSLSKRREEEAALFEEGLAERRVTESLLVSTAESVLQVPGSAPSEDHSDVQGQTDEGNLEGEADIDPSNLLEAAGPSIAGVKWNPNDDEQPDYQHLPKLPAATEFDLTPEDIETLIRFNAFAVKDGLVVFALRGARIVGADKREQVDSVTIADQRPDHRAYKCVIGVLDRDSKKLWAYKASTVCNANAVLQGFLKAKRGVFEGNVLPTGCYTYTVGIHRAGTNHEIRGVLRLAQDPVGASTVVTLRTINDLIFDRRDFWHKCAPADNIHPGRRNDGFSSLGCLTLPGDYRMTDKTHTGLWSDFRVALGMDRKFKETDNGRQFSVVLLTGQDAALASRLRSTGEIGDRAKAEEALLRIRFGSQGEAVAKLQAALGMRPDPGKLVGAVTREMLINHQKDKLGWADGILSPGMAKDLDLEVWS